MTTDTDTYSITVRFDRSKSDDIEVCEATNRTLTEQLIAELQEACDEGILACQFTVIDETLNHAELSTILAALRSYQSELSNPPYPDIGSNDIATDGGTCEPLTIDAIDTLCGRLNS